MQNARRKETFGVKNPEYKKNVHSGRIKGIRTWKYVYDELSKHYGKMKANLWYAERMNLVISWSHNSCKSFKDVLELYYTTFKESGFMPVFWIAFVVMRLRFRLRRITPLRKIYQFIKYKILRRPYPEF